MASAPLLTTADVINALGGQAEVMRLTKRKRTGVANWFRQETFPANTYLVLITALQARGLNAPPWLWNMEPRPRRAGARRAQSRKIDQPEVA